MKHTCSTILTTLILALSLARPVTAGPYEDAVAAYKREDYSTALNLLRPLAEGGKASAQVRLGLMYNQGYGVPQNYTEAAKWYRSAALKWFRVAANQGDAESQFSIGLIYNQGRGVKTNFTEAAKWYQLAADQGDSAAQLNLGNLYRTGEGVLQDFVRAYMWFSISAAQGNHGAATNRDRIAQQLTSAQIADAQKLASEWKPTIRSAE